MSEDGRTLGGTRQRLLGSLWVRHDHIGVVEEGTRAQVVIVDALRMRLQVALHVLSAEGEYGAWHGGQRGRRCVGQMCASRHRQGRRERWWSQQARACRGEGRERLWVSAMTPVTAVISVHLVQSVVGQARRHGAPEASFRHPLFGRANAEAALVDLRVGRGAIAAVRHGAASQAPCHAAERARASQLLTAGGQNLRWGGGGETEMRHCPCGHGRSALRNTYTYTQRDRVGINKQSELKKKKWTKDGMRWKNIQFCASYVGRVQ